MMHVFVRNHSGYCHEFANASSILLHSDGTLVVCMKGWCFDIIKEEYDYFYVLPNVF